MVDPSLWPFGIPISYVKQTHILDTVATFEDGCIDGYLTGRERTSVEVLGRLKKTM